MAASATKAASGNPNPYLADQIQPRHLTTEEKRALVAFLRALSGSVRDGLW